MGVKYEGEYKCGWCGHIFIAKFGKVSGKGKKQNGTSAVKCPVCLHNLRPEEDAIRVREVKQSEV